MAGSGTTSIGRWLWIAAAVVALDQATKFAVERAFSYGERLAVVPGFFDLTLVYNRGAAFSFLANAAGWQRWFFIGLGAVAAAFIVWLLARHGSQRLFAFALALILGGAIGNVVDRIARGHVVDFVLLHWQRFHWPAFNVADSAITIGAVLLVVDELRRVRRHR
ncbi:MAG: signal peptidase II [Burkholderiaceae bacterium]|nr:signal peptidase II [Burkholderiaceae bacterium]